MNKPSRHLQIIRVSSQEMLPRYQSGVEVLLNRYEKILLDDLSRLEIAGSALERLVENIKSCLPNFWILTDSTSETTPVYALATLNEIIPSRHAYLHGVMHPSMRRQAAVTAMALHVLETAFTEFNLLKVKAEFEADNRHALGFCYRMGFHREACFRQDIWVADTLKDVVVYSLTAGDFQERYFDYLKRNAFQENLFCQTQASSAFSEIYP